jgi:hypothetical protein
MSCFARTSVVFHRAPQHGRQARAGVGWYSRSEPLEEPRLLFGTQGHEQPRTCEGEHRERGTHAHPCAGQQMMHG